MEQILNELQPQTRTNQVRVGFYFFKPTDWFGWMVVTLQWLCGGKWNSHCHMMHSIDNWLFETTTNGTVCSNRVDAAFRLADDVFYIMVDEATAFEALEMSAYLHESNINFSLWECVVFCWHLLWTPNVEIISSGEFGEVYNHLEQSRATPPFSCTTVAWYAILDREVRWNSFTPAKMYQTLQELQSE